MGLGSNIGNRESYLERALEALQAEQKIRVVHCSSIYETEPYGPVRQPDFLNMVAQVETFFPPLPFLRKLQEIETALSRAREVHWGPRTIDLDLLVFGQKVTCSEALSLPHPEIARRAFVLKPLVEIAPHLVVPGLHRSVMDLWQNLNGGEDVQLWRTNNGGGKFGLFEN
nr:2-amino-4-hydroxy-6-hydroxymethyldihydropteridine diphosphokinase [Sporolactobacillus mangiferae]